METAKIYYASDVNISDHANLVVFDNLYGEKCAIWIDRYEDIAQIYFVELFERPSDSFISDESDLDDINDSCGTTYKFDQILSEDEQYRFTYDLCWYYGAINFDNSPNEVKFEDLPEYLETNFGII